MQLYALGFYVNLSLYNIKHRLSLDLFFLVVVTVLFTDLFHHGTSDYAQDLQHLFLSGHRYYRWYAVSYDVLHSFFSYKNPTKTVPASDLIFRQ